MSSARYHIGKWKRTSINLNPPIRMMQEFQDKERTGLNQFIHTEDWCEWVLFTGILITWSFNKQLKRILQITNMRKGCINKWQKNQENKKGSLTTKTLWWPEGSSRICDGSPFNFLGALAVFQETENGKDFKTTINCVLHLLSSTSISVLHAEIH